MANEESKKFCAQKQCLFFSLLHLLFSFFEVEEVNSGEKKIEIEITTHPVCSVLCLSRIPRGAHADFIG